MTTWTQKGAKGRPGGAQGGSQREECRRVSKRSFLGTPLKWLKYSTYAVGTHVQRGHLPNPPPTALRPPSSHPTLRGILPGGPQNPESASPPPRPRSGRPYSTSPKSTPKNTWTTDAENSGPWLQNVPKRLPNGVKIEVRDPSEMILVPSLEKWQNITFNYYLRHFSHIGQPLNLSFFDPLGTTLMQKT